MAFVRSFIIWLITIPLLIAAVVCRFLVVLIDFFVPKKLQELIPIIDVQRTFLLYASQLLAPPEKKQLEQAVNELQEVTGQVEEIAKGYAVRKAVGQSVDYALSFAVLGGLGVARWLIQHNIDPILIAIFASSATVIIATLAGFFGPIYELAHQSKTICLEHGAYRGASIYRKLEQIFGVPFMVAKSSFIVLDTPPVDHETLEDFKEEISSQLSEAQRTLKSLLGRDDADIPEATKQLVANLLENTENELKTLNYENLRDDVSREFAMLYFEQEFAIRPWKRKRALKAFAKQMGLSIKEAEDLLRLFSFKLQYGQVDSDFVQSILISGAAKGIIEKEQEYHEVFEDVEMNHVAIGLALGGIRFLLDHYTPEPSRIKRMAIGIKHGFVTLFAMPLALAVSFKNWLIHLKNSTSMTFYHLRKGTWLHWTKIRAREIATTLDGLPAQIKQTTREFRTKLKATQKDEQKSWQLKRKISKGLGLALGFIFIIPLGLYRLIRGIFRFFITTEHDVRKQFQSEVAYAALVKMYIELYNKLSLASHVSSAF